MNERMTRSYRAAKRLLDAENPREVQALLARVTRSDLVVVRGCYDRVEEVLGILQVPFELLDGAHLGRIELRPEQLLIINCPGDIDRAALTGVTQFVEAGGTLFSTDWALKHVLEPAFPGMVAYNNRPTADEVVRIEIKDGDNRYLQGVLHEGADPLWWLEGSSYPIAIKDQDKVKVLITSEELRQKYGEAPVAVTFPWGRGEVFHMISHYYLQRAETRTARHASKWMAYAAEVGAEEAAAAAPAELADLMTAEVEAAHKSARLIQNLIVEKQRKR